MGPGHPGTNRVGGNWMSFFFSMVFSVFWGGVLAIFSNSGLSYWQVEFPASMGEVSGSICIRCIVESNAFVKHENLKR